MTASLPMYQRPETADAHYIYWTLIRKHLADRGIDSPDRLTAPKDLYEFWLSPTMLFSQTCGMPYRNTLLGKVQLVGTPDFMIEGCDAGYYRSAVVVRDEDKSNAMTDFENSVFAFNSEDSQSGFSAAYSHFKSFGFWFENRYKSGGHQASAKAVASGTADIACIDAMTWRMLQQYEPFAEQLRVIDWTDPTPGLPYITSAENNATDVFEAVSLAIEELPTETQETLSIHSIVRITTEEYCSVPNPH